MSKEKLKNDIMWLGISFIALVIIAKVVFFKESLLVVIKLILLLFLFAILPGFILTYYIKDLMWIERFTIGTILMFAIVGVGSTVLGFFMVHFNVSTIGLVIFCYIVGGIFLWKIIKENWEKK